jgi:hypothetical protein
MCAFVNVVMNSGIPDESLFIYFVRFEAFKANKYAKIFSNDEPC